MRVELLEPQAGRVVTIDVLVDVLGLVMSENEVPSRDELEQLTPLELQLCYDWAMREHLHASNSRIQRRSRPKLLELLIREPSDFDGADVARAQYDSDQGVIREQAKDNAELRAENSELRRQLATLRGEASYVN